MGGRYSLVQQLGVGGFSQTFLAEDSQLPGHPLCVVKQLKPQVDNLARWSVAKRLFDTEATVLYQLGHHRQIPALLAHFEDSQEFYLVQELIEGQSLDQTLLPNQHWTENRVIVLLQDILSILKFVHEQNVIHRDIKPSNIICRQQDGRAVLIDFGAVKQVSTFADSKAGQAMTISIGTQGYTPTEQLSGNPRFNSDIYAVGMLGIQALTGLRPHLFQRDPHTGEIVWRQQPDPSFPDPDSAERELVQVSDELAEVLDRMVRYHFKDRYQTVAEPLQALEELLNQRSIASSVEFALLASESALAWATVRHRLSDSSSPLVTSEANGLQSAIGSTAFSTEPELAADLKAKVSPIAAPKITATQVLSTVSFSTQSLGARLGFRWSRRAWFGIGLLGAAAIAGFASVFIPDFSTNVATVTPSATPASLPALPCREPSPPPLPSRNPDYKYPNGTQYYGSLKNGLPTNGRVVMVFSTGNRYDGELRSGQRNGCGTYTFKNGKRYVGEFRNDQFEGQGIWMLGNGDRYVGSFRANQCQGEGTFLLADGSSKRGLWQDGDLINGNLSCNR